MEDVISNASTALVQDTIHCHILLITIFGIFTQRHHFNIAENKFALLFMLLGCELGCVFFTFFHFFVLSVLVNAEKLLLYSNKTNNAASNNLIKFFKAVAKLSKYMPGI